MAGLEGFKQAALDAWEQGDYRSVGTLLEPAARILVDEAGVSAGQRVLDVATGSGSVALAAARAGATVVGVDITDAWFDEAARRAQDAGVHVELAIGDAEDLSAADASFDVVLSGFGAIFAPRHERVAAELTRVCRGGGTIGLTAWPHDSANGTVFAVLAAALPPPPAGVSPSASWGDPDYVRALFAPHDVALRVQRRSIPVGFASVEAFEAFLFEKSGPILTARHTLRALDRWEATYAAMHEAIVQVNEADDGTYRATWEFLLVVGDKAP